MVCDTCKSIDDNHLIRLTCKHLLCKECTYYLISVFDTCWICKTKISDSVYNNLGINRPISKLSDKQIQKYLTDTFCNGSMPYPLVKLFIKKRDIAGYTNIFTALSNGVLKQDEVNDIINEQYISYPDLQILINKGKLII